ncbi:large ribosomal subunit protein mL48 [Amyelois transitella]|uniref:large ribosomal subunit protein mL48 n=1 Tax=Amyelois transitella TaxID=680683 RepID=UPI00298F9604|nr:large ribosomal subunit protein mL48 [Amyelois transitella]
MIGLQLLRLARSKTHVGLTKSLPIPVIQCQQLRRKNDLYEPDYLISMEPDEPVYDCLNLQLNGYDFALLESAQSQIHKFAEVMGIQVEECWATPAKKLKVQRFKPGGTVVDSEYLLNVYERNVQVTDVPAWALGTLLRVARASLPEGCTLNVQEHAVEHEEIRYVPDNQLIELKQQLEDMGGSRAEKKKKK